MATQRARSPRPTATARRQRRATEAPEQVLAELDRLITALIKENRELRQMYQRLTSQPAIDFTTNRILRTLRRRLTGATAQPATAERAIVHRRKITDPDMLARRRASLAAARAARAAKLGAQAS